MEENPTTIDGPMFPEKLGENRRTRADSACQNELGAVVDDASAPWNDLETMKKQANAVAMESSHGGDEINVGTNVKLSRTGEGGTDNFIKPLPDESKVVTATAENEGTEPSHLVPSDEEEESSQASPTMFSEYTSFAKTSSGFLYPTEVQPMTKTEVSVLNDESQEHTIENFNKFLEENGLKTIDFNENDGISDQESFASSANVDGEFFAFQDETKARPSPIGDPNTSSPQMIGAAPSVIVLAFDRVLDCIDPTPRRLTMYNQREDMDDQSSIWSLSMRSSLLRDLEAGGSSSSMCSMTTTNHSLDLGPHLGRFPRHENSFKHGVSVVEDGLDCFFPCWNDPYEELLYREEVGIHTNWDTSSSLIEKHDPMEVMKEISVSYEDTSGDDCMVMIADSEPNDEDEIVAKAEAAAPFIVSSTASSPKPPSDKTKPHGDARDDASSNSSISEIFDGLLCGSPSDEKDDVDELNRFLDQTSTTEATSTLSYSSGTISNDGNHPSKK